MAFILKNLSTSAFIGFLFLCNFAVAENISSKQLVRLKAKENISYEDLAHENPGCPENSLCSSEMGKKMKKWRSFVKGLEMKENLSKKIISKQLEEFREENGLPVTFLAKKSSAIPLDPILFNSRCEHHNPKEDKQNAVFKGTQFFRNDPKTKAAIFDSAELYNGKEKTSYRLPYEETPIMVKNDRLIVPRDHENIFYHLAVSKEGKWSVVNTDAKMISKAIRRMENVECPKEKESEKKVEEGSLRLYLKTYCKSLYNADTGKNQIIKLVWSCP